MSTLTGTSSYNPELDPEIKTNVFSDLPDQFIQYDEKTYNPLDFYTSSGEFNLALFNKTFRQEQINRIQFYRKQEEDRLRRLSEEPGPPKFHDLSVGQHLIQMKATVFNIISDISAGKPITPQLFLKDNRLFYLGLLFVVIFVFFLILSNLVSNVEGDDNGEIVRKNVIVNYN